MTEERTEGIILSSIPYLKGSRILKVFTRDAGLISVMAGIRKHSAPLESPLTSFEVVYRKKNSDLYHLIDAKILDTGLDLRKSYDHLMAAGALAKSLLASQLPGRKAPILYELFHVYLRKIPLFEKPAILTASFQLKLLQHDGLLHLSFNCTKCQNTASILNRGESFCPAHAEDARHPFTPDEWQQLFLFLGAQKFSDLEKNEASLSLLSRISDAFTETVKF